jgi:hypothetical protein
MTADYLPLRALLLTVSGWVHREQERTTEYLVEENRVLKEQFKGRKLRLNDDQRRRLAAKGKQLGRRLLNRVATVVTPDTIMRRHHRLIALKWTNEKPTPGRRGIMRAIRELIVRMALGQLDVGIHTDPGGAEGRGPARRTRHDREDAQGQRHRARPGSSLVMEVVPQGLIDLKTRRIHIARSHAT